MTRTFAAIALTTMLFGVPFSAAEADDACRGVAIPVDQGHELEHKSDCLMTFLVPPSKSLQPPSDFPDICIPWQLAVFGGTVQNAGCIKITEKGDPENDTAASNTLIGYQLSRGMSREQAAAHACFAGAMVDSSTGCIMVRADSSFFGLTLYDYIRKKAMIMEEILHSQQVTWLKARFPYTPGNWLPPSTPNYGLTHYHYLETDAKTQTLDNLIFTYYVEIVLGASEAEKAEMLGAVFDYALLAQHNASMLCQFLDHFIGLADTPPTAGQQSDLDRWQCCKDKGTASMGRFTDFAAAEVLDSLPSPL